MKKVVLGFVGGFILLFVVAVIIGSLVDIDETVEESTSTLELTTPPITEEKRLWTVAELADCDASILKFQMESDGPTNTQASDCEVELLSRQLETLSTMRSLPAAQGVEIKKHFDTISAMRQSIDQIAEDKVVDREEFSHICFVYDQWDSQLEAAKTYITSLNRNDLMGLEVDIERLRRVVSTLPGECGQTVQPAVNSDLPSEQNNRRNDDLRQLVIDKVGGDEELADEILNDPCFRGIGPLGFIWDMDCQMRR